MVNKTSKASLSMFEPSHQRIEQAIIRLNETISGASLYAYPQTRARFAAFPQELMKQCI